MRKKRPQEADDALAKASSDTISIRLDSDELALLVHVASVLKKSPGNLAKEWVQERLANPEVPQGWQDEVRLLHRQMQVIRRDLALGFQIAVSATGSVTPEDARAWADKNFRDQPQ